MAASGGSSEDMARKALEGALSGSFKGKDILADNDPSPDTETGGRRGQRGGLFGRRRRGGGGGEPDEPVWNDRNKETGKALGYLLAFLFFLGTWKIFLALIVNFFFFVFRIDPYGDTVADVAEDTSAEEDILSRWGDDDDDEE
ncbi:hypothetical protein CYMTET_34007 [Cymbomonas tetramitiformis]|uniref:Uncharacterized protein n=1 Tax=Cymbomonas tetramitiformis TaxID=36881 RepID=A0AAE0FBW4_9CHLO|nr:hypothetical protein CYMTET_34007 [Cymbomonas tetramitiformis]